MPIDHAALKLTVADALRRANDAGADPSAALAYSVGVVATFLANKIDELEQRLDASPLRYEGTYEPGKSYDKGAFVTHAGSLWHCNVRTTSRPGDGPAWTLAVKRGADGKDAK